MNPTGPALIPAADRRITVTAGHTPTTHIHDPESAYFRYYWLPELGSLSILSFMFLNGWLANDDATITVDYDEFARSLGTTPARLAHTVQRLVGFHLAYIPAGEPATLYLRRRVPTLNTRQLARLAERCPTLAAAHDELLHTAA